MITLRQITEKIGDGLHGTPNYSIGGEYTFINGNNLFEDKIIIKKNDKKVSESEYIKYKKDLNQNTLFLSINGTLGNFAFYNNEKIVLGKSACYLNLKNNIDKKYIGYVLKNKGFQKYIESNSTGTTIKNVSLETIRNYTFDLPPINIQNEISDFLSSLDTKIELNKKINENLISIIQKLFKSWFLDFDPVLAKLNNIPTGLPKEIDNLFPNLLEETEFGKIPKGWKINDLFNLVTMKNGNAFKSKDWTEQGVPVIKIRNVKFPFLEIDKCAYVSKDVAIENKEYSLSRGDILIGMTGYVGEVCLVPNLNQMPLLNQRVGKIIPKSKYLSSFIFSMMLQPNFKNRVISISYGSAQQNVSSKEILKLKIVYNEKIAKYFSDLSSPILEKLLNNFEQNSLLYKIRDYILPKLISNDFKVSDLNKIIVNKNDNVPN